MNPDTDADPATESSPKLDLGHMLDHQVTNKQHKSLTNTKYGRNES